MEEDYSSILEEYGIEEVDLIEDDLDLLVLPTVEERPSWMD